jgi:Flp pilus assembly protein CpaB
MRKTLLVLGAVLGVLVAIGIFLYVRLSQPVYYEVPVAINDVPAGTPLKPQLFRLSRISSTDGTVAQWVQVSDWPEVEGRMATTDIRAGFPIARAQIDPNSPLGAESRLSVVITGTNDYYVIIPTTPDEVGNFVQSGDRVDLIITIPPREIPLLQVGVTNTQDTPGVIGAAPEISQAVVYPVSKLVMQNMTVLRVERDRARETSSNNNNQQNSQSTTTTTQQPDVKRLYVKVDRDQLEVLSFVLNTGKRNIAVRAATGSTALTPTDGVTWDDFAKWFFAQRGSDPEKVMPFESVGPYQTKDR